MKSSRWDLYLYLAALLGCSSQNSGFSGVAGGGNSGTINFEVPCSGKPLICIFREENWDSNATLNEGNNNIYSNRCPKAAVMVHNLISFPGKGEIRRWRGQITLPSANYFEFISCNNGRDNEWGQTASFSLGPGDVRNSRSSSKTATR